MRMIDIISNKRDMKSLSENEIKFFIEGAAQGTVPDYQLSVLLMAIYLNGMNDTEISLMTKYMAESGEMLCLDSLGDKTVDKHSTGGVGDKTTLICGPIAAALGCKVAKMSGRGLGHTGGTVDKLESIAGYKTELTRNEFFEISQRLGICLMGHNGNFAPADSKLYALRDVTSTVESIPLIASSIMSKKLAAGANNILLDVKFGSGAFMKNESEAEELAVTMVKIGKNCGINTAAVITDMSRPLGKAIGNSLEVMEAVEILKGKGDKRLYSLCITLAAYMYSLCFGEDIETSKLKAEETIADGSALRKFCDLVEAHGGDVDLITGKKSFPKAQGEMKLYAQMDGYITKTDSLILGRAARISGAGREKIDDKIDFSAGILLNKQYGDKVKKGDLLATVYGKKEKLNQAFEEMKAAFETAENPPLENKLIFKTIKEDSICH